MLISTLVLKAKWTWESSKLKWELFTFLLLLFTAHQDWHCSKPLFPKRAISCVLFVTTTQFLCFSDVVYDPSIIPALVRVLSTLLHRCLPNGVRPVAYIASTIRNTETRDIFLSYLGKSTPSVFGLTKQKGTYGVVFVWLKKGVDGSRPSGLNGLL